MRVEREADPGGINGVVVGIGVSLAMAADIASWPVGAPASWLRRVGTSPDGGATLTVTAALGYERAMRFFLEQRMVSAAEALDLGLVGEVTASDDVFPERFIAYGQMLAGVAPIVAQQTKRLLSRATTPSDLREHLDDEVRLALHGLSTDDSQEAVRAMMTKTTAEFRGH